MSTWLRAFPTGALFATTLALVLACSASGENASDGTLPFGSGGVSGIPGAGGGLTGPAASGGALTGSGGLPPEMEVAGAFQPPVVTGGFLWSANPESGRVALIEATTLATRVVSAGLQPKFLTALPTADQSPAALVINTGNSTATLLRAGPVDIATFEVPIHTGADSWSVAPSGEFAVAFSRGTGTLDPTQGLQDVTLIDAREEQPVGRRLTAGYRPRQVVFDEQEESLIVVSQQGISIFDLDGSQDEFFLPLSGTDLDVSITRDGRRALVHAAGSDVIEVIALEPEGTRTSVTLAGEVTDIDLSSSGRAVAVVRELSQMVVFDVDDLLQDSSALLTKTVAGELVGSVELSPDGEYAVLFTTTGESDRLTIVLTSTPDLVSRTLSTETPIASVRTSPDGLHAVALGQAQPGVSTGSFTVVSLAEQRFPRIIGTKAPVVDATLDDTSGVVTTSDGSSVFEAYVISMPSLNVEPVRLASPPVSAGVLPEDGLAFVSQVHASGRVSFFDLLGTETRTLTGFELSADVVDD